MKTLLLMRHAKSSWGDESLPDFDRPLNARGKRDSPRIGRELIVRSATPELIITSTASRAIETTECLCGALGVDMQNVVQQDQRLYGASSDRILDVIDDIPDSITYALVVGHNPGMQDLVTSLIGEWLPEGMKTATVACIRFDVQNWSLVGKTGGELSWLLYPGHLSED